MIYIDLIVTNVGDVSFDDVNIFQDTHNNIFLQGRKVNEPLPMRSG